MKYLIIILTLVGLVSSSALAQDNYNRNNDNFRRDRGGGNTRRFDRNGNGSPDSGRFDRTRDRTSDRTYDRSYDRPRESVTASTVAPVTVPTPARTVSTTPLPEPEPFVETVSTNTGPVDPRSYDAFRIIATRNIFDPNRYPGSNAPGPKPSPPPKRTELFTLVGSISYDKGDFAFFDGSSSEYRKTVKPGDTIAGYKVAEVAPDKVTLEANGKTVELPVGSQMKRQGDEEWKVNSRAEPMASTSSSSSSSSTNSSDSSATTGDMPDALKRLLEQRKNGN
jgi:hypothetical protein